MPAGSGVGGANPSPGASNLIGMIARALGEGSSARSAMSAARAAGARFSDSRFRQLWQSTASALERRSAIDSLPANRIPDSSLFQPFPTRTPGGYRYQVTVTVRDSTTGDVMQMPSAVIYDRAVSPGKAVRDAVERASSGIHGSADYPGLQVEGGYLSGLYQDTPWDEEGE